MNKVIAIFGAGTGLSSSVAKLYGQQGYEVALIARNEQKLQQLSKSFEEKNIKNFIFTADLSKSEQVSSVVSEIINQLGRIDIIYFAPNPRDNFNPAFELTSKMLQPKIDLYFFGLMNVIREILPIFRKNNGGAILSAVGGSAVVGYPFMSGLGPVMAASRNYLQSLQQELVKENIHIGLLTITAMIQNSENYETLKRENPQSLDSSAFPIVDPDELALRLSEVVFKDDQLEVAYP